MEKKHYFRFFCDLLLTAIATGMFVIAWLFFIEPYNRTTTLEGNTGMIAWLAIYIFIYVITARGFHAFRIGVERKSKAVAAQVITLLMTDVAEFMITLILIGQFKLLGEMILVFFLLFVAQSIIISLFVSLMIHFYRRIFPALKVLEIHGDAPNDLSRKVNAIPYKYHVEQKVHFRHPELEELIMRFDAVMINDLPSKERNELLKFCFANDKRAYFVPKISDILVKQSERLNLIDTPLCLNRNCGISATERIVKRAFDLIFSGLALIIASPILGVTALAIKLNDGGPVFFRQERCTIGGKRFMILKFRSMIVDAEKDGRSHPAGEADDRITKVGRVIRATRIDELPQIINILKGEMSIVGPRPERVEHVLHYTEMVPEFALRSKVKGGLTGYAQVYGKYNTTALDKIKLDLMYITNYSLLLDFQIIIETLKIIFQKESTEGFSEDRAAEMHDVSYLDRDTD